MVSLVLGTSIVRCVVGLRALVPRIAELSARTTIQWLFLAVNVLGATQIGQTRYSLSTAILGGVRTILGVLLSTSGTCAIIVLEAGHVGDSNALVVTGWVCLSWGELIGSLIDQADAL